MKFEIWTEILFWNSNFIQGIIVWLGLCLDSAMNSCTFCCFSFAISGCLFLQLKNGCARIFLDWHLAKGGLDLSRTSPHSFWWCLHFKLDSLPLFLFGHLFSEKGRFCCRLCLNKCFECSLSSSLPFYFIIIQKYI